MAFEVLKNRLQLVWLACLLSVALFLVSFFATIDHAGINIGHGTMIRVYYHENLGLGFFHNSGPKLWAATYKTGAGGMDFSNEWGLRLFIVSVSLWK